MTDTLANAIADTAPASDQADIIGVIMDGTQPVDLTGRKLTRANAIPLDWPSQRKMFGFV